MSAMDMEISTPNSNQEPVPDSSESVLPKSKIKDFSLCENSLLPLVNDEILNSVFPKKTSPSGINTHQVEVHPFVSAAIETSRRGRTQKGAETYLSAGDARLDFFFGVMEQTTKESTLNLLKDSWDLEPLHTLKLLANLRDIRKGKGIRPQYQWCLYWLYEQHPKTLYDNLGELMKFGYWKDLLHLLVIIVFDGYMHPFFKRDANPSKEKRKNVQPTKFQLKKLNKRKKKQEQNDSHQQQLPVPVVSAYGPSRRLLGRGRTVGAIVNEHAALQAKNERMAYDEEKRIFNQKIADYYNLALTVRDMKKNEMEIHRLRYAREMLMKNLKYRVFHMKIAELFATKMVQDLQELKKKDKKADVSLAAKWAPTLEKHFDKFTLIASTIAIHIAEEINNSDMNNPSKSFAVKTYLARKLYHKEYCVPLRAFIEIPERPMSENRWNEVNYSRVPAKCMSMNKQHFISHDKERFEAHLKRKDSKVAGASLKPVEIICEAMNDRINETERCVVEKQWESLIESIRKRGCLLKDAICICDVSGSMGGNPMKAAIGLTLITMSMTAPPWNKICITFSEHPELFHLEQDLSLTEKLERMKSMNWGGSTNLHATFELIVKLGVQNDLTNEQMPKILFIFTDMEFDQACGHQGKTNYEAAQILFASKGFTMPTVVCWNLRDTIHSRGTSTPVRKSEVGAILVSGFSAQTLSYILEAKDLAEIDPLRFMLDVVNDERYKSLVVSV